MVNFNKLDGFEKNAGEVCIYFYRSKVSIFNNIIEYFIE